MRPRRNSKSTSQICEFISETQCRLLCFRSGCYKTVPLDEIPLNVVATYINRTNVQVPKNMIRSWDYLPKDGFLWKGKIIDLCKPPKERYLIPEEKSTQWFLIRFQNRSDGEQFPLAKVPLLDIASNLIENWKQLHESNNEDKNKDCKKTRKTPTISKVRKRVRFADNYPVIDSNNKAEIRNQILAEFRRLGPTNRFFVLESASAFVIDHIQKEWETVGYPSQLDIANINLDVCETLNKQNFPSWVHVEHKSDYESLLEASKHNVTYKGIWLDRQCTVSADDREQWKNILSLIVNKKLLGLEGILAVTFCDRSRVGYEKKTHLHRPYTLMMEFLGQIFEEQESTFLLDPHSSLQYLYPRWHPFSYKNGLVGSHMHTIWGLVQLRIIIPPHVSSLTLFAYENRDQMVLQTKEQVR